ncbi:hypothetical protein RM555_09295 [Micromonospora sp. DSM 115977]|uniref:Uncharacterized protein n=1 Tax=Micromonospora reichwaldensis TaxID=3075516 RepID=A0ABU2WTD2_9ACTN|nr:hypothetical protein [Micromonospora sp. DSM 115977]MDT0529185.1 hypothetical protein [Micromonospora sp. DSM 115977]
MESGHATVPREVDEYGVAGDGAVDKLLESLADGRLGRAVAAQDRDCESVQLQCAHDEPRAVLDTREPEDLRTDQQGAAHRPTLGSRGGGGHDGWADGGGWRRCHGDRLTSGDGAESGSHFGRDPREDVRSSDVAGRVVAFDGTRERPAGAADPLADVGANGPQDVSTLGEVELVEEQVADAGHEVEARRVAGQPHQHAAEQHLGELGRTGVGQERPLDEPQHVEVGRYGTAVPGQPEGGRGSGGAELFH